MYIYQVEMDTSMTTRQADFYGTPNFTRLEREQVKSDDLSLPELSMHSTDK